MVQYVSGDLIELAKGGEFDVILHGCNCHCTWGAGIAKYMRYAFPEAYRADANTRRGDENKLGKYSSHHYPNGLTVVNCYTQYGWNAIKKSVDYTAVEKVFERVAINFKGKKIGLPKIGAGLGGGDWNIIEGLLNKHLPNAVVVEYIK